MLEKYELFSTLIGILSRNKKSGVTVRYVGKALDKFFEELPRMHSFEDFEFVITRLAPEDNDGLWIVQNVNWADQIIYVNDDASKRCSTFVNFAYRAMVAGRLKDEFSGMTVFEVLNKIKNELPATPSYELKNSDE